MSQESNDKHATASSELATPSGSEMAAAGWEIVPTYISRLADACENGEVVIGGMRCGKTWAAQVASAKPVAKRPSPNVTGQPPATGGEATTHHQPLK